MPVADSVVLGNNVTLFHPTLANFYGGNIGDDTKIGASIGSNAKPCDGGNSSAPLYYITQATNPSVHRP